MRIKSRPILTMAGLALAAICRAQDPSAAQEQRPAPSPTPLVAQPIPSTESTVTTEPTDKAPAEAPASPADATAGTLVPVAPTQDAPAAATVAPPAHAPKVEAPARHKAEVKPSAPADKADKSGENEAAEAAAATAASSEPPQSSPPPAGGSTAPPAPTAASQALPPCPACRIRWLECRKPSPRSSLTATPPGFRWVCSRSAWPGPSGSWRAAERTRTSRSWIAPM